MTQQNILEQAKQGNAQAIAALMNRTLQPKGITAKASMKDDCLRVMLESEDVPEQRSTTAFIQKGMQGLGVQSISKVQVFGRQVGEEFPAWSQELSLGGSSSQIEVIEPVRAVQSEVVQPETETQIRCPKCNSTQISAGKKGFGVGKAAAGVVLLGPLGLAGGMLGSGQVQLSCINCGHQWEPAKIDRPSDKYTNAELAIATQEDKLQAAAGLVGASLVVAIFFYLIPKVGAFLALLVVAGGIWAAVHEYKSSKPVRLLKGPCPYCARKLSLMPELKQVKCEGCQRKILINDRKLYQVAR
ncbi:hypothetical protein NDA01_21730 [Trichocoleus desertorum AS-A10]|uniref:hypothetical protein n=1 Tax=Trichocoleus desertorum TaxID=1481672 RepID=UPI003296E111